MEIIERTFIETDFFTKKWFKLGFSDDDLAVLQNELIKNNNIAPVMEGTGGLKKYRFAIKGRGKSNGSRVCFIDFIAYETIYLIDVFAKNEKVNLSDKEKYILKKLIKNLKKSFKECEGK